MAGTRRSRWGSWEGALQAGAVGACGEAERLKVDVLRLERAQFPQADGGVQQQQDDGGGTTGHSKNTLTNEQNYQSTFIFLFTVDYYFLLLNIIRRE
jgi:hypothetical protein